MIARCVASTTPGWQLRYSVANCRIKSLIFLSFLLFLFL